MVLPDDEIEEKVNAVARHTFRSTCHQQGVSPEWNNPHIHCSCFHITKGISIRFDAPRQKATRGQSGLSHGLVFTEKAIKRNHKVLIVIDQVEQGHESGLAFGVTTCDPATITPENFPQGFSELVNMPLYWNGSKFMAGGPAAQSVISFWITDDGEFKYEKDTDGALTAFRISDNSRKFYMFFDVSGSTLSIKLKGFVIIPRADLTVGSNSREGSLRREGNEQALLHPQRPLANIVAPAWPAVPPPGPQMPSIGSYLEASLTPAALATFFPRGYPVPPMALPRTPIGFSPYTLGSRPTSYSTVMAPLPFIPPPPPPPPPPPITSQNTNLSNTSRAASTTAEEDVCTTPIAFSPYTLGSRPTSFSTVMAPLSFIPPPPPPPPPPPITSQNTNLSNTSGAASTTAEEDLCNICKDAPKNSVILPCGHISLCYECACRLKSSTKLCTSCQVEITEVVKTFKS